MLACPTEVTFHAFGLTGGIGSGKSTVASRFRARGLPVVSSDDLAREVVAPGTEGLAAVVEAFGSDVLRPDGSLDRPRLAALVFRDGGARRRLNALTHPAIRRLTEQRFSELLAAGEPLVCNEVPLLVESGLTESLRPLVVVRAEVSQQIQRTQGRDGTSVEQIRARIESQLPLSEKLVLADYVIDNRGALLETTRQADEVLDAICATLGMDPIRYPRP